MGKDKNTNLSIGLMALGALGTIWPMLKDLFAVIQGGKFGALDLWVQPIGFGVLLAGIYMVWRALNKRMNELEQKGFGLTDHHSREYKRYVSETWRKIEEVRAELNWYVAIASIVHEYRMEHALTKNTMYASDEIYNQHVREKKLEEWNALEQIVPRHHPELTTKDVRKYLVQVLGYDGNAPDGVPQQTF